VSFRTPPCYCLDLKRRTLGTDRQEKAGDGRIR
jgi:hypothetical protein